MRLTAVIIAKNEARHIRDCVASLLWCDEVLVLDTGSDDDTAALAEQAGARVVLHHPFENYAQTRNAALDLVTGTDWVFFVDADERATLAVADEVRAIVSQDKQAQAAPVGYWVPRHNYIFGKLTLYAGYYPDYQMRLLRQGCARYERPVHEVVALQGAEGHLKNPIIHYNYDSVEQFHVKQGRYVQHDARELYQQGIRFKPWNVILQPLRHFWWRYVTLQGCRDGLHGLRLSGLLAYYYGLRTYLELRALQRE